MTLSPNINSREFDKFRDGNKVAVTTEDDSLSLRVDTVSSTLIYIGEGLYGASTLEPKWKIKKIDTSSGVVITNASNDFDQIWNDRAGLTYV